MKTFNLLIAMLIAFAVPYCWFSDAWTEPYCRYPDAIARYNSPVEWVFCLAITLLLAGVFLMFAGNSKPTTAAS